MAAAATPRTRLDQHESVSKVAATQNAENSTFRNGVSVHRMRQSVSFSNLAAILGAAADQAQRTFVGTMDGCIVVSVNFGYERKAPAPPPARSKKRSRDPHEEAAEQAVAQVRRRVVDTSELDDATLGAAQSALRALLADLRGASGETAIESWGLSFKKPEATGTTQRPRLILSVRLTPGVAVPLELLFRLLGPKCKTDGMMTTQDSAALASGFNLPLSEQAQAAEAHGQRALTLFATVTQ